MIFRDGIETDKAWVHLTFTGVDDSVRPIDLIDFLIEYPFVEFGILIGDKDDEPRWPSYSWLRRLRKVQVDLDADYESPFTNFSIHICGPINDFLTYKRRTLTSKTLEVVRTKRIQLNTGNQLSSINLDFLNSLNSLISQKVILQISSKEDYDTFVNINKKEHYRKFCPLFDSSRGNGIYSENVFNPLDLDCNGYAGGINEDNICGFIDLVLQKFPNPVGRKPDLWIDMESSLRNKSCFDLYKCANIADKVLDYLGNKYR